MKRWEPLGLWLPAILLFNLFWYGWLLSFPLFGEDGAALYSFLVETAKSSPLVTALFPLKWLEGLGQPNVFVTLAFDPFSWLMVSGLDPADAFRISYALRASVCWALTYFFVGRLFRGHRSLALTAALLSLFVNFTLTHPAGIPTFAGIFVATHAAVFPGLVWLYWCVVEHRGLAGGLDIALAFGLGLFALMYPLGSSLGLCVLWVFGFVAWATASGSARKAALHGLFKLTLFTGLLFFAPIVGLYTAWGSVASISAREVFNRELTSYAQTYSLPLLWDNVPVGLRVVVVAALVGAVLIPRASRPVRMARLTLILVIVGSQVATVLRAQGVAPDLLERLPRAFYLEYYLPPFYAICAAYALHAWPRRFLAAGARIPPITRLATTLGGTWLLFGKLTAVALTSLIFAVAWRWRLGPKRRVPAYAWRLVSGIAIIALFVGATMTWLVWPEGLHPLFFGQLSCQVRAWWCRDPAGLSVGAGANPITDFLKARLAGQGVFHGRAEFLLVPGARFVRFPVESAEALTAAEFETIRGWYTRAYALQRAVMPRAAFPQRASYFSAPYFRRDPSDFRYEHRTELVRTMDMLARSGEPSVGILPDEVIEEIFAWAPGHLGGGQRVKLQAVWDQLDEVTVMVQERNRNFLNTGNGMLLRALPFHGIPVASSYEQALDYLYYLFWTRYVNQGAMVQRSINFTSLEVVRPERLALVGVRYLVARDVPFQIPVQLPAVFSWRRYKIFGIPEPNLKGYGPTRVVFKSTLTEEFRAMRTEGFDPQQAVVAAERDRFWFGDARLLAGLRESRLWIDGQTLRFAGRSGGGRSVAVLPFRFSHCWKAAWLGPKGRILRVDGALLAVLFDGATDVALRWSAGYGPSANCLRRDASLVSEAVSAARELG